MVEIEINSEGLQALMKSPEMLDYCQQLGDEAAAVCGEGYEAKAYPKGKTRINVSIRAESKAAIKDNLANNTILKALSEVQGKHGGDSN